MLGVEHSTMVRSSFCLVVRVHDIVAASLKDSVKKYVPSHNDFSKGSREPVFSFSNRFSLHVGQRLRQIDEQKKK